MCYIVLHEAPHGCRRSPGASAELERIFAACPGGRDAERDGARADRRTVRAGGRGERAGTAHRGRSHRSRQGQSCRPRSSAGASNATDESRVGGHASRSAVASDRLSRRLRHREDHHAGARTRAQTDPGDGDHAPARSARPRAAESHRRRSRYSPRRRRVSSAGPTDGGRRAPCERAFARRRSRSRHHVRPAPRCRGRCGQRDGARSRVMGAPGCPSR